MSRNYVALPYEYGPEMSCLTDEEFGRLLRALMKYSEAGEEVRLEGNERFFAVRVMRQEDRFQASYEETSDKKSRAGRQGASKRWSPMDRGAALDGAAAPAAGEREPNDGDAILSDGKNSSAISANSKDGTAITGDGKNGKTETETKTEKETETNTKTEREGQAAPDCAPARAVWPGEKNCFDVFWSAYPNKSGKQAAERTWRRIKPDEAMAQRIIAAVERQKTWEQWRRENGRYIPNPATWLAGRRWEDEPPNPLPPRALGPPMRQSVSMADFERMRGYLE